MSPFTVLFIITRSDAIGGAHIHVRDMAAALRGIGVDARVAVGGDGPYLERLAERGIPVERLAHLVRPIQPLADLRGLSELRSLLRARRPTLVSVHSSKAGLLARMACRSVGVPVVFTAHGWSFTDGVGARTAQLYRQVERFAGRLADRIITVSHFDQRIAELAGVGDARRLRTVHNGMPTLTAAPAAARPKSGPVRLVMTARLDEQKDHRTLLAALGQLRDADWQLDLIGEGPSLPALQQQAHVLRISERIRFLGLRNDVAGLLGAADLFLLISHWEGFPRSILEAMRAGLPVVATDVAGVSESVREGVNGVLVARHDADDLARKLRPLLADASLRRAMGEAGRQRFLAEFTFERMFQQTLAVYDEVMAERGLPARFLPVLETRRDA